MRRRNRPVINKYLKLFKYLNAFHIKNKRDRTACRAVRPSRSRIAKKFTSKLDRKIFFLRAIATFLQQYRYYVDFRN